MSRASLQTTSFATAKAELSKYVDEAEHNGRRTVITRHGKPAAVLVPVSIGIPEKVKRKAMTRDEAFAFLDSFAGLGDPSFSAVVDVIAGRR